MMSLGRTGALAFKFGGPELSFTGNPYDRILAKQAAVFCVRAKKLVGRVILG